MGLVDGVDWGCMGWMSVVGLGWGEGARSCYGWGVSQNTCGKLFKQIETFSLLTLKTSDRYLPYWLS